MTISAPRPLGSEAVVQRKLNLPSRRPRVGNLAESCISCVIVWISVTRNIECVEEIRAELDRLILGDMEILEE